MASKRPRQPRHHRIDAACGRNFCYPAHKIIPIGRSKPSPRDAALRGQCRHHSLYVQETGGGLRGSSTRISCQPQPEATSESRTLGISEVVGGSNASAHGELSSSRALGASQKIDQHLHGDGFTEPTSVRRVQAAPLWLCARSATGQYCHKEVACVGKGEKSCAPRAVPDIQY